GAGVTQLEQTDPLVEAKRLITFLSSRTEENAGGAASAGMPNARGIAVVRERAHTDLQERLAVAVANTSALDAGRGFEGPLYANDVARGYRMDVESFGLWY